MIVSSATDESGPDTPAAVSIVCGDCEQRPCGARCVPEAGRPAHRGLSGPHPLRTVWDQKVEQPWMFRSGGHVVASPITD